MMLSVYGCRRNIANDVVRGGGARVRRKLGGQDDKTGYGGRLGKIDRERE